LVFAFEPGHEKESFVFSKFQEFLTTHNKKYNTIEEYMARFNVFKNNYLRIENMASDPNKSYTIGITKFFDLTPQEFKNIYLKLDASSIDGITCGQATVKNGTVPESYDWRQHGAVGPVKDQGQCGSCWAFSTVGNIEGLYQIKHGNLLQFAEQQLVDCDKDEDQGCEGGLMENAMKYINQTGGLELQANYKYTARDDSCKFSPSKVAVKVGGYECLKTKDEEQIKAFLAQTGPLAVALNADPLQVYQGGIIDEDSSSCDPESLDHGVTLVGYGSENGKDYWIVKNSWGESWGENGYFRMARGKGTCGINTYVITAHLL